MKKIYRAPTSELLGIETIEVICTSVTGTIDNLEMNFGGKDKDGSHEADANKTQWDRFDQGF